LSAMYRSHCCLGFNLISFLLLEALAPNPADSAVGVLLRLVL